MDQILEQKGCTAPHFVGPSFSICFPSSPSRSKFFQKNPSEIFLLRLYANKETEEILVVWIGIFLSLFLSTRFGWLPEGATQSGSVSCSHRKEFSMLPFFPDEVAYQNWASRMPSI